MSIYLDNAATSFPKPESVYAAVLAAMRDIGASPGRGGHKRSLEAGRLVLQAREKIAELFAIPDAARVIFTHSATESLNLALRGTLVSGDHVITSSMEHNSLIRPLNTLRKEGIEVTVVQANRFGLLEPDDFRAAMQPNTRMLAVGHVSNVSGSIQPLDRLAAVAREAGAFFLVDAAQSAGTIEIDVVTIGIDLLAVPGHKGLYGPQGTGFLYAGEKVPLRPLLSGGTGSSSTMEEQPLSMPEGFEAGTHNLSGIAGLKAGVEFVLEKKVAVIGRHEQELVNYAAEKLGSLPGVRIYGPVSPELRAGLLSFTVEGIDPTTISFMLDHSFDIAVRSGLHCAPQAHRSLGSFPEGSVRISPGWFSTREDMDQFCDALAQCITSASSSSSS